MNAQGAFDFTAPFDGPAYDPALDYSRLGLQIGRVYAAVAPGRWLTLREISTLCGDPEASVSAQLRHLRKPKFGSHVIEKRRRGDEKRGLWEYRLGSGA